MSSPLRDLLSHGFHLAPGAYDCISAKLIEAAGFSLVYVSGYGLSASRFGKPDLGLITMTEMLEAAAAISDTVSVPVIADADTGYGGPLNVARLVKLYENGGIAGIQFEDQLWPKRCGHMAGKKVIPCEEMVAKIKSAVDARRNDTLIIARTDAIGVEGFDAAIERARLYTQAGADMLFVEGPGSTEQVRLIPQLIPGAHVINMAETGKANRPDESMLETAGYRLAIYPITALLLGAKTLSRGLAMLQSAKSSQCLQNQMITYQECNALMGMSRYLEQDAGYQTIAVSLVDAAKGKGQSEDEPG